MTIEQNILNIIRDNPQCADNDKLLITKYWQMQGLDLDEAQIDKILQLTTPETITRARRKLQHDGDIKPTMETLKRRVKEEYAFRRLYGNPRVKDVIEPIANNDYEFTKDGRAYLKTEPIQEGLGL